ncbi:hypothetical protein BIW11_01191 [Tropilaelaps mercedesae]|uniref:Chitin-binding type-2 domain-containing protein n=1 Tax=Tropilaelaps mercedesae TaxID=418985 RepID=A0A1V9XIB8_9ACAR|nr:hypothetical protein BIW11_01191 [Tropilaelaps mercedesae]
MRRFTTLLLPAVTVAAQLSTLSPPTTPSPEARYLGLAASADQALNHQPINIQFSCANRPHGYYADIGNGCKIYHICNPQEVVGGKRAVMQYSFFCPSGTTFDQQERICTPSPTTPCVQSEMYYNGTVSTITMSALEAYKPVQTVANASVAHTPDRTVSTPAVHEQVNNLAAPSIIDVRPRTVASAPTVHEPVKNTVSIPPVREQVNKVLTVPVVHTPAQTISPVPEVNEKINNAFTAPVVYTPARTIASAPVPNEQANSVEIPHSVVPGTPVLVPTGHHVPAVHNAMGQVMKTQVTPSVVETVAPSAAVSVPTNTAIISATPVTSTTFIRPLYLQAQPIQHVYAHQEPHQIPDHSTVPLLQHQAENIKHFPEPNYHPLTISVPHKVFRVG